MGGRDGGVWDETSKGVCRKSFSALQRGLALQHLTCNLLIASCPGVWAPDLVMLFCSFCKHTANLKSCLSQPPLIPPLHFVIPKHTPKPNSAPPIMCIAGLQVIHADLYVM